MTTRERPGDRGRRRGREDVRVLALDFRRARIGAGLSLRAVANATGIDHTRIWRFERGAVGELTVMDLGALGAAVGLDVRLRAYPAGDPIRDAGQQRLLERLRSHIHRALRWSTEVPLPAAGDLRAWDAVIRGDGWSLAVEAETVLDDLQALERRLNRKPRDGGVDHVLLLVADTRRNRRAVAGAPAALADLDRDARAALQSLRRGRRPAASAIVLL